MRISIVLLTISILSGITPSLGQTSTANMSLHMRQLGPIERALHTAVSTQQRRTSALSECDRIEDNLSRGLRDQPSILYPTVGGPLVTGITLLSTYSSMRRRIMHSYDPRSLRGSQRSRKYHQKQKSVNKTFIFIESLAFAAGVHAGNRFQGSLIADCVVAYGTAKAMELLLTDSHPGFLRGGYLISTMAAQLISTVAIERHNALKKGHPPRARFRPFRPENMRAVGNAMDPIFGTNKSLVVQPSAAGPVLAGVLTSVGCLATGIALTDFYYGGGGELLAMMGADAVLTPITVHLANNRAGNLGPVMLSSIGSMAATLLLGLITSEGGIPLLVSCYAVRIGLIVGTERGTGARNIQSRRPPL